LAVAPAVTVAVPELPGALNPRPGTPAPDNGISSGMEVFPAIVRMAEYPVLKVAGTNVTVNVQEAFTATCCVHPFCFAGTVKTGDEL
jgi:hypothetical protein